MSETLESWAAGQTAQGSADYVRGYRDGISDAVRAARTLSPSATAQPLSRRMLTAQEVADEYGIAIRTVRRLDADGRLPAYVLTGGRTKRYRREDVDRLFEATR